MPSPAELSHQLLFKYLRTGRCFTEPQTPKLSRNISLVGTTHSYLKPSPLTTTWIHTNSVPLTSPVGRPGCTCKAYPSSQFFPRVKWGTSFCAWGVCSLEEVLGLTPALDKRSCLRGNTVKPLQVALSESLPNVLGGCGFPFSG